MSGAKARLPATSATATTPSKKIFMSAWIDPSGNQLTYAYDSNYRLTSVTDAIGQVTTLTYVSNTITNSGFYLVSQVTDPFSRSASFTYNTSGQLIGITDIIGIESQFTYGTGDFVSALTTPYGTTNFVQGGSGINLTLKITDPKGGVEFLQYDDGDAVYDASSPVPTGINTQESYNMYRNTYYIYSILFI